MLGKLAQARGNLGVAGRPSDRRGLIRHWPLVARIRLNCVTGAWPALRGRDGHGATLSDGIHIESVFLAVMAVFSVASAKNAPAVRNASPSPCSADAPKTYKWYCESFSFALRLTISELEPEHVSSTLNNNTVEQSCHFGLAVLPFGLFIRLPLRLPLLSNLY
ncbi:hypothetical protein [Paraburkholderia sp. NMBU_R16]|uniref:hypothetical protein n=1 Tax=Paraburkholderia sp. NMBU_R16 TaxID=2698676 RepID=UPI001566DF8F|nr:hypothetical protein [Paraburkholderia sp. NMBU_R16]